MESLMDSIERMSDRELLAAYYQTRRALAEKKFSRDTERGRLGWQSARLFVTSRGGVTERQMAVEASEDLAKKGQHIREMTLDMEMQKVDADLLAMAMRCRGTLRLDMDLPNHDLLSQDGFMTSSGCDKFVS